MHECFTVRDWIRAWTEVDSEDQPPSTCCRCVDSGGDLARRLEALRECPECARIVAATPGVPDDVVDCPRCMEAGGALEALLDELEHFDPAVAAEHLDGEEAYRALVSLPADTLDGRIVGETRFHTWSLCQRLLREAQDHWRNDPVHARARAATAVAIAAHLDEERYHPRWVADLRAKAHAYLGNGLRVLARFGEAERELAAAEAYLRRGVESGRQEARILSLRASLLLDLGRRHEAEQLLVRIEEFYRAADERTELARTRLKRAEILSFREEYRAAAEECAGAYGDLDPRAQPRLALVACQNAVQYLVLSGEVARARSLFESLAHSDERMVLLRRKWIEADLLRAEGRSSSALAAYEDARQGYAAEGLPYTVALISLDQATAAYELGDLETVRELAREAGTLLGEAGARREMLAVLRVLRAAIEQGTLTRSVLTAIRKRVAETRPSG